jgi:hypothetical protein
MPLTNGKENYVSMADRFHPPMTHVLGYEKFTVGADERRTRGRLSPEGPRQGMT